MVVLYNSYVLGRLSFASSIWNPRYNIYINRLESIQNKLLRFISYKFRYATDYSEIRRSLGMLSLESRRRSSDICTLHKILHNQIDSPDILEKIRFYVPAFNTRVSNLFRLPLRHTNAGQNSPLYRMMYTYDKYASNIDRYTWRVRVVPETST